MREAICSLSVLVCLAAAHVVVAESQSAGVKVIVNASNSATSLTAHEVSQYFLKRTTQWHGQESVVPVDLPASSPVRERFSREVLGRSATAVDSFWTKQIFSGAALPPLTLPSERDVVAYVRQHPGAIGYVSGDAGLGEGVKAVEIARR